jgi:nucleotide-binding universal stress UspA family protein
LGGILYELATGRLPFGHPATVAELKRRFYRDPVPPRTLVPSTPPWLQEIVLRCLEVDARDRYASAREIALALSTPAEIPLTERGSRERRAGLPTLARRRIRAARFVPAPCPPPSTEPQVMRVVAVAISPQEGNEALRVALRDAARSAIAADPGCRIACITVVPPAATLSGVGEENSATGRHINRLIELRGWAKPLELPEERVTYHVLESDKPGAALVDYVRMNDVAHIVIGAPAAGTLPWRFGGAGAQVVGSAPCTVTVVRPRSEG